jgi:hypothetical protein
MADVRFDTAYAFSATGAPIGRTMAVRLNDVINVKDWGAVGDGVADDKPAIQAAVDYAMTLNPAPNGGAIVFIPKGTYKIGTPPLILAKTQGCIKVIGAGRDATILKGNWAGTTPAGTDRGFLVYREWVNGMGDSLVYLGNLTIWNESQVANTGAFLLEVDSNSACIENCHFHGVIGADCAGGVAGGSFGTSINNCKFTCSIPMGAANSTKPGPAAGTVGLRVPQGQTLNCQAEGFNIGFGMLGNQALIGCSASRCNIGIYLGTSQDGDDQVAAADTVMANRIDRCIQGIRCNNFTGTVAGNVIAGTTGPADPATIQSISWGASGGGTATVTTSFAHNLPVGTTKLVLVTKPTGWTPDNSGDQIVTCTRTGTNTFTYSLGADPGAPFTSGTWNHPLKYGVSVRISRGGFWAANVLSARVSTASFDMNNDGATGASHHSLCVSMRGLYGWIPTADRSFTAGTDFVNCGKVGTVPSGALQAPVAFINFADLGSAGVSEGREFTVVDAQTQRSFGGTIAGGSSTNHYKVRDNGTNWIRVG